MLFLHARNQVVRHIDRALSQPALMGYREPSGHVSDAARGVHEDLGVGEVRIDALRHDLDVLEPAGEFLAVALFDPCEVVVDFVDHVPLEAAEFLDVPFGGFEVEVADRGVQVQRAVEQDVGHVVLSVVLGKGGELLPEGQDDFVFGLVRDDVDC